MTSGIFGRVRKKILKPWFIIPASVVVLLFLGIFLFFFIRSTAENPDLKIEFFELKKEKEHIEREKKETEKIIQFYEKKNIHKKMDITLRNLKLLRGRLSLYLYTNHELPSKNEIQNVLGPVPDEYFSNSDEIFYEENGRGGWFYDLDTGRLAVNSDKMVGKYKLCDY